jgi:hypothetical protein
MIPFVLRAMWHVHGVLEGGGGAPRTNHLRACAACVLACTRRLTRPLLPNANANLRARRFCVAGLLWFTFTSPFPLGTRGAAGRGLSGERQRTAKRACAGRLALFSDVCVCFIIWFKSISGLGRSQGMARPLSRSGSAALKEWLGRSQGMARPLSGNGSAALKEWLGRSQGMARLRLDAAPRGSQLRRTNCQDPPVGSVANWEKVLR